MPTPEGERALKPGEWNDLGVSVRGSHIVIHLNGHPVTDYNDASPKFTDGVIGLHIHTGGGVKMGWKDVYIKEKKSLSFLHRGSQILFRSPGDEKASTAFVS